MPRQFYYGGAEVQAEKTIEWLRRIGVEADYVEYSASRQKFDLFHFFGVCAFDLMTAASAQAPIVVSPIYYSLNPAEFIKVKILRKIPFTVFRGHWKALSLAKCLLPNSNAEKLQLKGHWGVAENRIRVVPNGVDEDFVGNAPDSFRKRFLPGWALGERFVFSAHRIESRKNSLLLVQAALKVGIPLAIAGQVNSSAEERKYVSRVLELVESSSGKVCYLGALCRNDLRNGYAAAHVHALPSALETPGLASLEAGLNGANLVVGDCSPVREYFDGMAEFSDGSLGSLCSALERTINQPRDCMGQSRQIRARFTWRRVAEETRRCYEYVFSGASA